MLTQSSDAFAQQEKNKWIPIRDWAFISFVNSALCRYSQTGAHLSSTVYNVSAIAAQWCAYYRRSYIRHAEKEEERSSSATVFLFSFFGECAAAAAYEWASIEFGCQRHCLLTHDEQHFARLCPKCAQHIFGSWKSKIDLFKYKRPAIDRVFLKERKKSVKKYPTVGQVTDSTMKKSRLSNGCSHILNTLLFSS